jgi:hypothetical protein
MTSKERDTKDELQITNYRNSSYIIHPFPMLSPSDFLHLPYTSDLTEGGIAYSLHSLPYANQTYDQIRHTVAGAIVELAFRRYLSQQDIPFDITAATPFTDPTRHDVSLGRHHCDIKSFLISHRDQIAEIRRDPCVLLNASVLVPSDHHANNGNSDNDLYLFAFLSGVIAASQNDLKKSVETNQPYYLMHVMPEKWRKPFHWNPLGPLVLKSESATEMLVEISGQDSGREI